MKIFKYSFIPEKIVIDKKNGEPKVIRGKERKLFFAYTHESSGIFEELFEQPLLTVLDVKDKENKTQKYLKIITDKKFILCLAASSYLEINDGKYCNSIFNADKFIETDGIEVLANDRSGLLVDVLTAQTKKQIEKSLILFLQKKSGIKLQLYNCAINKIKH